ncbi:thioredoxin family protein [Metabacillus fastidiosus]|uniref:thioredoxin family protein n=1 Tax=Metabacillus fastidiosus TaxID=1458 RepID=UPI003D271C10
MLEVKSKEQFDEAIQNEIVLFYLYAPWCGPCKVVSPILKELSEQLPYVKFAKTNVEDLPKVAEELNVNSIPTVLTFVDGSVVETSIGFNQSEHYTAMIIRALEQSKLADKVD